MKELLFVVLILFAIGFHEFGHFITAKKFGMKVDRFFIGFGPRLWSVKRGETEYGFNWIPAGGYVRIAGMNPFEEVPEEDRDRVFKAKKAWQRAIVLAAGSTMHFILAFFVLAGILMTAGVPDGPATTTVAIVDGGTPAAKAGFRPDDRIIAVDGVPATSWEQVRTTIRANPGKTLPFTLQRGSSQITLQTTLASANPEKDSVGFLGVSPTSTRIKRSPPQALWQGFKGLGIGMKESFMSLGRIVSPSTIGHLIDVARGKEARTDKDPVSIVGITRQAGGFDMTTLLLYFVGFNIFIGVVNLMPLPPLDGGHLAVLVYEKVRGRDVDMRKLIPVTVAVLLLMVGLFLISLYLDIFKFTPGVPG